MTSGLLQKGASLGLSEDATAKALGPVMGKIKGKGFAEASAIASAQLELVAAGMSPEDASKKSRGTGRGESLRIAGERENALMQREPGLFGADRNRRIKSLVSYEETHPVTDRGRLVMDEGFAEERRRSIDEATARRAGYIPKEGEGFSAWKQVKQDVGGGRLFDKDQQAWDRDREAVEKDIQSSMEFSRATRNLDNLINGGSR